MFNGLETREHKPFRRRELHIGPSQEVDLERQKELVCLCIIVFILKQLCGNSFVGFGQVQYAIFM